jgi:hypothetical protein
MKIYLSLVVLFSFFIFVFFAPKSFAQEENTTPTLSGIDKADSKCTVNGQEVDCAEVGKQVGNLMGGALGFIVIISIIGFLSAALWIMMLIHASTHPIENKPMWILLQVFLGSLGSLIYYFAVKKPFDEKQKSISNQTFTTTVSSLSPQVISNTGPAITNQIQQSTVGSNAAVQENNIQ